jgi:cyanate permease
MTTEKFFKSNTALITLIAACGVVLISLGVRQTFGLFFNDFQRDLGVSITESGLAIGIQMLMWGLTGPIFGAIADKYGGHKAIMLAFIFYSAGIYFLYTWTKYWNIFSIRSWYSCRNRTWWYRHKHSYVNCWQALSLIK